MKDIMKMNETFFGGETRVIRLCGGVSKSPYWCQMFADIFEKPIELTEVSELGCLGAAMCAGVGAGLFADVSDAVSQCVHIKERYLPNEDRALVYRESFQKWSECLRFVNKEIYI